MVKQNVKARSQTGVPLKKIVAWRHQDRWLNLVSADVDRIDDGSLVRLGTNQLVANDGPLPGERKRVLRVERLSCR
jgi:hypothetical protein